MFFLILWQLVTFIQGLLSYGTIYRLTKNGGDNGVSLFGWTIVFGVVSMIPGLGVYLWIRYRNI